MVYRFVSCTRKHVQRNFSTSSASIPISSIEGPSKPGEKDEEVFDCTHPSNLFWKEWAWDQRVQKYGGGTGGSWRAFGSVLDNTVADKFSDDPEYWAYHCGRSLAFASQGALSLSLHSLRQTLSNSSDDKRGSVFGLPDNIHKASLTAHRLFSEALFVFKQDREHIRNGFYKRPWDMEDKRGRQYNPVWIAKAHANYMNEALRTLEKRSLYGGTSSGEEMSSRAALANATSVWLKSGGKKSGNTYLTYPDYYLNNTFHFQTDGWLSSRSASVYETSTETLFIGRQDAMQRHCLVPINYFLREREKNAGSNPPPLNVLELGAGTGRFHTFLRDNLPLDAHTAMLDLSPFYLEQVSERKGATKDTHICKLTPLFRTYLLPQARENYLRWQRLRASGSAEPAAFIHAAAESVPLPDNSQDIVVAVYLLHEIPPDARRAVVAEAARLLRPGGLMVIADSIQLGDRPALDTSLGIFSSFNEPYYESYIKEDLGGIFSINGLQPDRKLVASSTKVLAFRKIEGEVK